MPATTGDAIVGAALRMLNIIGIGRAIPGPMGDDCLDHLNRMLSQWRIRGLTVPLIAREIFNMTALKGSTTNPYTIGSGGDLDTARPSKWSSVVRANLVLTDSDPDSRIQLTIYTEQMYAAQILPDQEAEQPEALYYNPTYASDLGSVHLWPVPSIATNDLELFLEKPIAKFDDLSTTYYLPDGADDTIVYKLTERLAGPYGRVMHPDDKAIARESFSAFKRSNVRMIDVVNDATFAVPPASYNITTGV